jgi:hypothetical protein
MPLKSTTRDAEPRAGREDAGSAQPSRLDRVAQGEHREVQGTKILHGREAGVQRGGGVRVRRTGEAQVHVAVDQTGQERHVAQVDDPGTGRHANPIRRPDGADAARDDEDRRVGHDRAPPHVDETRCANDDGIGLRSSLCRQRHGSDGGNQPPC